MIINGESTIITDDNAIVVGKIVKQVPLDKQFEGGFKDYKPSQQQVKSWVLASLNMFGIIQDRK